jgi:3-oxoacyl-[acyl-carrier protein] reductase
MKRYSEIKIGDKEFIEHTITQDDIEKFVQLTGDDNKLHIDEKFAKETHFKKPVVHGMLGASFISTIIGTKLPGDGALWYSQTLDFLLPVRVGDHLTISGEVIKKNDKERSIELDTRILNQNKQVVTKGTAKVKVIERIEEKQETKEFKIEAKVAIVIGATGGIGQEVASQLAKDGFKVVVHYNSNKILAEELVSKLIESKAEAIAIKADLLNSNEIKGLINDCKRKFGAVDVLVNCSAVSIPAINFQNLDWEDFQKQIDFCVKSAFLIIQEALPHMIEKGYGRIVNIGSLATEKPNSDWAHYITAKSALIGFSKSLAFELAPKGLRINMVTPGLISTELTSDIPEKVKLRTAAQTPTRRLATPSDVAHAVSFLVSDKADFINGENIRVNGGQTMI